MYSLKQKCAVKVSNKTALMIYIDEHPSMAEFNRKLANYNEKIEELHNNLKVDMTKHKDRIDKLKKILRTDLSALERSVITMTLKEDKKSQQGIMRLKKKELSVAEKALKTSINKTLKEKKALAIKIRKTMRSKIKDDKKQSKKAASEEKKRRKTMRKEGHYEELKHETLKNLVGKYKSKIASELVDLDENEYAKIASKEEMKKAKADEKERARLDKQRERVEKQQTKRREREQLKEQRKKDKDANKTKKQQGK
jgi:hypothetical protein